MQMANQLRNWALSSWQPQVDSVAIREPLIQEPGYWVGAPSVLHTSSGEVLMSFRYRRPRGEGRGYEARIARSVDGVKFDDIWSIHQEALETSSVERFALAETPHGYLLYLSYVDPKDRRWRIDVVEAERPDQFDVSRRVPVFTPQDIGMEAAKDPVVVFSQGLYWMYVSCASRVPDAVADTHQELHVSEDVYTTGRVLSQTGLAVSRDGIHYDWLGLVLSPTPGAWDAYAARVSSLLVTPDGVLALYDGGASVDENYEEKSGLALVAGWDRLTKLSLSGPWWTAPHGSHSLRYVAAIHVNQQHWLYYESARADGAHEIRLSVL